MGVISIRLNAIMRGYPIQQVGVFNRQWIIGKSGDIYKYQQFDPLRNHFSQLSMFFSVPKERLVTHPNFWYFFGYFDKRAMAFGNPAFGWQLR